MGILVIFDKISTSRDSQSSELLNSEEWASVLELSTMWKFQSIRAKAIKALESLTPSMDPVDKIVLARKCDVSPWLFPSLHALVQREKPLDLSEGNRLGLEWVLKVAEVREYTPAYIKCRNCSYSGPSPCAACHQRLDSGSDHRADINFDDKIRKIFALE